MGFLYDLIVQWTQGRALETSDQALDSAADFQQGFAEYIGLYNDYTGSSLTMEADIQRPYDELRGIDFAKLWEVAELAAAVADEVDQSVEDTGAQVATVNGWTGNAGDAFRSYAMQFSTATTTIERNIGSIATATGEAVPAAQRVIAEYVDVIGDITFAHFDSPGDIRVMIEIERMLKSVGDVVRIVTDWLGDLIGIALPIPGGGGGIFGSVVDFGMNLVGDAIDWILDALGMSVDGFLDWIAGHVRAYLDVSFARPFEANLNLLHSAVEAAKSGIDGAFAPMQQAASAITQNPFDGVPVPPEDNPNQAPQPPNPVDTSEPPQTNPQGSGPGSGGGSGGGGSTPGVPPVDPGQTPGGGGQTPGGGAGGGQVPSGGAPGGGGGQVPGGGGGQVPGGGGTPQVPGIDLPQPQPGGPTAGGGSGVGGGGGGTPQAPGIDLPQPGQPPVDDGPGGRPDDLPPGAGWISDPSQLPQGWTVDRVTGELLPPGAPGGTGDPEVHSPAGRDVLDGDEPRPGSGPGAGTPGPGVPGVPGPGDVTTLPVIGDGGLPGSGIGDDGGPTSVSMREGDVTVTVSGDGAADDDGLTITLTDAAGNETRYEIGTGPDGTPTLVPVTDGASTTAAGAADVGPGDSTTPVAPAARPESVPAFSGADGFSGGASGGSGVPTGGSGFGGGTGGGGFGGGGFGGGGAEPAAASAGSGPTTPPSSGVASGSISGGPASTVAAAVGFGIPSADSGLSAVQGDDPGRSGVASGSISGGPSFAAGDGVTGGATASGSVSGGVGTTGHGHGGMAQLATAADGSGGAPGGAQLASAQQGGQPGQPAATGATGGGAPMMPMGAGAVGGGDEERRPTGSWRMPGDDVFADDDGATRGVIGEDR